MATATRKRPRRINAADLQTAQAEASLKYGPQRAALSQLIGQVESQYRADADAARAAEAATRANLKSAVPRMRNIYAESGRSQANTASEVDAAMAARPQTTNPVAAAYQASLERERGTAQRQTAEAKAGSLSDLETRRIGAGTAREVAINQARSEYGANLEKIRQQAHDLGSDAASYVTSRIGALRSERAKLGAQTGKVITSGAFAGMTNAEVRALSPTERQSQIDTYNASKGKPKGGKTDRRTAVQRQALGDRVTAALDIAQAMSGSLGRSAVENTLRHGATPAKDSHDKPVPKFGDFASSLATDLAYLGYVSPENVKRLHDLGYKVNDIPAAIGEQEYRKRKGRQQDLSSTYGWGQ